MTPIPEMYKAIFAGIFAAVSALATVLVGDIDFGDVTAGQWVAVVVAGLAGFQGTYWIKNAKPS